MTSNALPQENHRILIIDDNEAIHDDLRKILAPDQAGAGELQDDEAFLFGIEPLNLIRFDVQSAYQGQEGLERVRQSLLDGRPFAVAFVDIRMPPGWDGVETITRIREVDPNLQTVICTAYSDYSWSDIHRRLGHSDSLLILKKPFDNIEVTQLAYALSRKWQVSRQAELRMADMDRLVAIRTAELQEAQQRIQRELEDRTAAQEAFQTIFQSGPFGIALIDKQGSYIDVNRSYEQLLGLEKQDLIGRNIGTLSVQDRRIFEECRDELRSQGRIEAKEINLLLKREEPRTVLIWVRRVEIQDCRHDLLFILDITERRRMEEELRRARTAAEEAARAKTEFVTNVSHEIRTPMNGIIGFTQLALNAEPTPEQREYLNTVETSAQALLGIINNILDFSKIESGRLELERLSFSLRECLEAARMTVSPEAIRKGLELTIETAPEVPDALAGDPGKLRQVVLNLLGNGLKFTEHGSVTLRVSMEEAAGRRAILHFTVEDTGIGIPPEKQARVFEPFRQVDGSVTRKYGGTGLGLAISAKLVEIMGGRIWLESEPGRGTKFHFTCRFDLAQAEVTAPRKAAAVPAGHTLLSILVTDDNPTNRTLASLLLKKYGHTVVTAANGVEAVERVAEHRFDLVLMDLQMPEMDGFQALAEIRKLEGRLGRHIPVVAMTAHAVEGEREHCLEAGMDDYLSKPYGATDLLNLVSRVGDQFSLECNPPAPGPKAILPD